MKRSSNTWMLLAVLAVFTACIADVVLVFVGGHLYTGYSQIRQPMSLLGAEGSPVNRLVSLWWIAYGLLLMVFALAFYRFHATRGKRYGTAALLVAIYGAGEGIGSGIFPGGHLAGHLTATAIVHNVLGGAGVLAILLMPVSLLGDFRRSGMTWMVHVSRWVTLAGVFFFALFTISRVSGAGSGWLSLAGLWQRLFTFMYYAYLLVLACIMLRSGRAGPSDSSTH